MGATPERVRSSARTVTRRLHDLITWPSMLRIMRLNNNNHQSLVDLSHQPFFPLPATRIHVGSKYAYIRTHNFLFLSFFSFFLFLSFLFLFSFFFFFLKKKIPPKKKKKKKKKKK